MSERTLLWDYDGVISPKSATQYCIEYRYGRNGHDDAIVSELLLGNLKGSDLVDAISAMPHRIFENSFSGQDREDISFGIKMYVLEGMTMGEIKKAAKGVAHNPGVDNAIYALRKRRVRQYVASSGLPPFIIYDVGQLGIDHVIHRRINVVNDKKRTFIGYMLGDEFDDVKLTHGVYHFKKHNAIKSRLEKDGVSLKDVVYIDDANVHTLRHVMRGGGLSIAYKPNGDTRTLLNRYGIPIWRNRSSGDRDDLRCLEEVVLDPRIAVITQYVE